MFAQHTRQVKIKQANNVLYNTESARTHTAARKPY